MTSACRGALAWMVISAGPGLAGCGDRAYDEAVDAASDAGVADSTVDGSEDTDAARDGATEPGSGVRLIVTASGGRAAGAVVSTLDGRSTAHANARGEVALLGVTAGTYVRIDYPAHWSSIGWIEPSVGSLQVTLLGDADAVHMARQLGRGAFDPALAMVAVSRRALTRVLGEGVHVVPTAGTQFVPFQAGVRDGFALGDSSLWFSEVATGGVELRGRFVSGWDECVLGQGDGTYPTAPHAVTQVSFACAPSRPRTLTFATIEHGGTGACGSLGTVEIADEIWSQATSDGYHAYFPAGPRLIRGVTADCSPVILARDFLPETSEVSLLTHTWAEVERAAALGPVLIEPGAGVLKVVLLSSWDWASTTTARALRDGSPLEGVTELTASPDFTLANVDPGTVDVEVTGCPGRTLRLRSLPIEADTITVAQFECRVPSEP